MSPLYSPEKYIQHLGNLTLGELREELEELAGEMRISQEPIGIREQMTLAHQELFIRDPMALLRYRKGKI
jgi:hypothetical protein